MYGNRSSNFGGFNGRQSNSRSYNQGYGGGYTPRQQAPKKRTGCSLKTMEDGSPIISGWRVSKGQMYSLYARPYKNTKKTKSKNGKEWMNLFVTIINKTTMQETSTSGMFDCDKKKLYIKDFNLIANPRAPRGGYFGKHISSNYNR